MKEITEWMRGESSANGSWEMTEYENSLVVARQEGTDFCMPGKVPKGNWHVFLLVHEGELRLTANKNRIGFDKPVYIDFIPSIEWEDITFAGKYCASFIVADQSFFMEATDSIRGKITERILQYSQSPFTALDAANSNSLMKLEDLLIDTMREEYHLFRRESLKSLICAWQYKCWSIFSWQQQVVHTNIGPQWNNIVSHFFHLAYTNCREHRGVSWYAGQIGVSPDTLSATLKRLYGKTASTILEELLAIEAKTCLRNPILSVQDVAEMLHFSDQSAFNKFFKRYTGVTPNGWRKLEKA